MRTAWMMSTLSLLMIAVSSAMEEPQIALQNPATHLLRSSSLRVEVMDPTHPDRYNRGVRFCSVANVLRVAMQGHDFLFSPVTHDPLAENGGLCSEFDIGTTAPPPGFSEASTGEGFLKIGVGVLRKEISEYDFFHPYELIRPAQTRATWSDHSARFEQSCAGVNGYAYRLEAEIMVEGNAVEVKYSLTNSGKKPFTTEQYAHNFFSFDGAAIGPDYIVQFPYDFSVTGMQPWQEKAGKEIEFTGPFPAQVDALNLNVLPPVDNLEPNTITVFNRAKGMSVLASVTRPSLRIAVHASPRYLCPEQFVLINLQPGESQKWVRRYEFHLDSPGPGASALSH